MNETPKRPRGRPPGRTYPLGITIRMTPAERAAASRLGERWGCGATEAIRRALREAARREGVE